MATTAGASPVDLLTSILAEMKTLNATMEHILGLTEERMKRAAPTVKESLAAIKEHAANVVSAAELDGPHGDPIINAKDPRDWAGDVMKGKHFSECEPGYLDLLAQRYDYFNTTLGNGPEDTKKRNYNLKDAARARGWAARLRNGWKPTQQPAATQGNPFGDSADF